MDSKSEVPHDAEVDSKEKSVPEDVPSQNDNTQQDQGGDVAAEQLDDDYGLVDILDEDYEIVDVADDMKELALKEKEEGNIAYKSGDYNKAVDHYKNAIDMNPNEITFRTNLAAAFIEEKSYDDCINECKQAIKIGRKTNADKQMISKAFIRMSAAYKKLDDLERAKDCLEKASQEHDNPQIALRLAEVDKLIERKKRWADDSKMSIADHLEKAKVLEENEKLDEALAEHKKVLEKEPNNRISLVETQRLSQIINERNEKLKEEMLGKLKDLGNTILKPFGLSTSNFKLQPNEGGGYSINFQK